MVAVSDAKLSAGLSLLAAVVIVVAGFWPWHETGWGDVTITKRWPRWVFAVALLLLTGAAYLLGRSE